MSESEAATIGALWPRARAREGGMWGMPPGYPKRPQPLPPAVPLTEITAARASLDFRHLLFARWLIATHRISDDTRGVDA